jgi:hypothetical protein
MSVEPSVESPVAVVEQPVRRPAKRLTPISDEEKENLRALRLAHPTLTDTKADWFQYNAVMARSDVPDVFTPSAEILWIGFQLTRNPPDWPSAPSKRAATWFRRLRMDDEVELRRKFWSEHWPDFMDSVLALELKSAAPPPRKRVAAKAEGVDLAQSSIDGFKKPGNGQASDAGS